MSESRQRIELGIIRALLLVFTIILVAIAIVEPAENDEHVLGVGLALEAGGALAIFARAFVDERGFWLIRREADEKTILPFYLGGLGLVTGFTLQWISVVLM